MIMTMLLIMMIALDGTLMVLMTLMTDKLHDIFFLIKKQKEHVRGHAGVKLHLGV